MNVIFSPSCETAAHAGCHLDPGNILTKEIDGSVPEAWQPASPRVSGKLLIVFSLFNKALHDSPALPPFSLFQLPKPKGPLNAKVFIKAGESGLARGHSRCSNGCLGKAGIKRLPVTGRGEQLR